jgi:hypothetical protein
MVHVQEKVVTLGGFITELIGDGVAKCILATEINMYKTRVQNLIDK